jgi:hypothetical protein
MTPGCNFRHLLTCFCLFLVCESRAELPLHQRSTLKGQECCRNTHYYYSGRGRVSDILKVQWPVLFRDIFQLTLYLPPCSLLCHRYPYSPDSPSSSLCNNYMENTYMVTSLSITGKGKVIIDCGMEKFLELGRRNTGRIVSVKIENLTLRGGVGFIGVNLFFPSIVPSRTACI